MTEPTRSAVINAMSHETQVSLGSIKPGWARMRLSLSFTLFVALMAGCGPEPPLVHIAELQPSELPGMLRPVAGASEIKASGGDGVYRVSYLVDAAYPASDVLASIKDSIPPEWTPRKEDSLNPWIPTSHVRGWTNYKDLTTTPESFVHAWQSEWENEAGDLLSYNLIYRSVGPFPGIDTLSSPNNASLRIGAEVVPRAVKEYMHELGRRQAKRFADRRD